VVAWDVDEGEDPAIAADLVSRACLRERISKGRKQPLVLHAENGNAMRATPVAVLDRVPEPGHGRGVPGKSCSLSRCTSPDRPGWHDLPWCQ